MRARSWEFDHVGLLVHDIASAQAALRALGYDASSERFVDERQGVDIVFSWRAADPLAPRLEIVQPNREDSVVSNLLAKSGSTPYHMCFRANPLEPAIEALDDRGFRLLGEPMPAPAFDGARFCFLYHRDLGLVELVELADRPRARDS